MSLPFSPDALRAAALEALGGDGDERAREAIEQGEMSIDAEVTAWESSRGTVRGHRVRLEVPAAVLAPVRASPAAMGALQSAFAVAIAAMGEGEALVDFEARVGAVARRESPYRGRG